jgi:hypothetical protein
MNFYRHPFRPLATFAVALFVLVACQNATEPTNATGPIVANGTYTMGSSSRLPDSVAWRSPTDSGSQKPICSQLTCSDTFLLSKPLGTDSLAVQLWTLGIRTSTIYFGEVGSSPVLALKASIRRDTLDTLLLSKYDTASQKASFSALGQGASSLVAYYAKLILAGDTSFKGKALPVGMNTDSVKKDLVYLGIQSGLTENQIVGLAGLDSNAIRTFAGVLVNANLLRASDTTALLHPVRVATAASVSGSLTAGGAAVAVSGSFSWNTGVQVSLSRISVRTQNSGDSSKFQLSYQFNPRSTETSWVLSGNLTVQALASAPVGTDTLVVTLSSDPTHSATVRVPFQVVAAPPSTPKLVLLAPSSQLVNTLSQATDSLFVSWGVSNWNDVNTDSVSINGSRAAKLTDSTWGQNVYVVPNGQTSTITFRAVGKNGTATTSYVQVVRARDTIGPSISWQNPTSAISVDATVSSYKVQVKAVDLSGVDSVYLQGVKASNDSGAYWSAMIPLGQPNGVPVKVVAKAWDKLKNPSVDSASVSITRNVPSGTDAPALVRVSPKSNVGNTLPFASDTLHVVYNITDLVPLDSIKILFGTVLAKHMPDSTWVADVPVPFTGLPYDILIQAANTKGNGSLEHIGVTRSKDLVPPTIVPGAGTVSQAVPWATKSIPLSWTVSDNYKMSAIALNRQPQLLETLLTGTYPLAVGPDSFVVVASDSFGNTSADTVVIARGADTTPPLIVPQGVPTSLPYVKTATVVFAITDNDAVSSVLINQQVPSQSGNVYTANIPLVPGPNPVVVVAKDPTGNSANDSLSIQATDNIPPAIAASTLPVSPLQYAKTATVSFMVMDNDTVASVLINNQTPTRSGNTYTATIPLQPGSNSVVVVAKDRTGNPSKDSVNIQTVLRDREGNFLRFGLMPDGKIWTLQNIWGSSAE